MARTSYVEIPEPQIDNYWGALQVGDRYTFPRVTRKSAFLSRIKIKGLNKRTYLRAISAVWELFSAQLKQDWKDVDPHLQKHGWRTFVADKSERIKLGIPGNATPNQYHQGLVGSIDIQEPANEVKLVQLHPSQYWVNTKVSGKKAMYQPVSVTEALSLPLKISFNYKSDLISTEEIIAWGYGERIYGETLYGDDGISESFVKFYARVRHFYQGRNIDTDLVIDIPLISDWALVENTLSKVLGEVSSYNLYIYLNKVRGILLFDNVKSEHGAQNWVRDTYCEDISKTFTRAFYQIPKHWAAITLPAGATYNSKYPEE